MATQVAIEPDGSVVAAGSASASASDSDFALARIAASPGRAPGPVGSHGLPVIAYVVLAALAILLFVRARRRSV